MATLRKTFPAKGHSVVRKVKTVESFTDDLDGTAAVETVSFSIDGVSYEIDLNRRNAKKIRADLGAWAQLGRKSVRATGRGARRRKSAAAPNESAAVRAWAAENNVTVSARGRIPADILAQYRAS